MSDWRNDPATDRQREYAKELGIKIPMNATKGEASDIISEAGESKSTYHESNIYLTFKKESIFKKIGRFIGGRSISKKESFIREPERVHAKRGTYDETYFVNPKTGRFQFPKYKHSKNFLVEIKDETDYKDIYWDGFDPEEKRTYTMKDFEQDFCDVDIQVESFKNLFYKSSAKHLEPLGYLKGQWSIVEQLLCADEDWVTLEADSKEMNRLLAEGYLFEQVVRSIHDKNYYYNIFKVSELKAVCKQAGIKSGGTKRQTIDRMIASENDFGLPKVVVPAPKFSKWVNNLIVLYIDDIKRNANRFHPLHIEYIWEAVLGEAGDVYFIGLENEVKKVIDSAYWKERFLC